MFIFKTHAKISFCNYPKKFRALSCPSIAQSRHAVFFRGVSTEPQPRLELDPKAFRPIMIASAPFL
jgi:hypothetical protein